MLSLHIQSFIRFFVIMLLRWLDFHRNISCLWYSIENSGDTVAEIVPIFFSIRVFFDRHPQLTWQQGKKRDHFLFHSTTSTRSRTFRHLFATSHGRWLSHIFNRNARIYQTVTRWDLPPYRITIWLIDDVILIFVYLLAEFILGFVTAISQKKQVDSDSSWLSSLYYKRTD